MLHEVIGSEHLRGGRALVLLLLSTTASSLGWPSTGHGRHLELARVSSGATISSQGPNVLMAEGAIIHGWWCLGLLLVLMLSSLIEVVDELELRRLMVSCDCCVVIIV